MELILINIFSHILIYPELGPEVQRISWISSPPPTTPPPWCGPHMAYLDIARAVKKSSKMRTTVFKLTRFDVSYMIKLKMAA